MEDLTDQMRTKEELLAEARKIQLTSEEEVQLEVLIDIRDVLKDQLELSKETKATRNEIDAALVNRLQDMTDPLLEKVKQKEKERSDNIEDIPEIKLESGEGYEPPKFFCVHGNDAHTCTQCYLVLPKD